MIKKKVNASSKLSEHIGEIKYLLKDDYINSDYTQGLEYEIHIGNSEDIQHTEKGRVYSELRKKAIQVLLKKGVIIKLIRKAEVKDWQDVIDGRRHYEHNFGDDEYVQVVTINERKLFSLKESVLYVTELIQVFIKNIFSPLLKAIKDSMFP